MRCPPGPLCRAAGVAALDTAALAASSQSWSRMSARVVPVQVAASVAAAAVVLVPELAEPVAFFAANAVISALEVAIVVAIAAVVQVLASLLHTAPDVVALILSIVEFVVRPFGADEDIHGKEGDGCTLAGV